MKRMLFILVAVLLITGHVFTPVTAASETCGKTYTVQHGDNLTKIAETCGTTIPNILALNPQITDPNVVRTGQVLVVAGTVKPTTKYTTTYVVKSGDTLTKVANRFGITVQALQQANPELQYNSTLKPGQVLNIPSQASTSTSTGSSTGGSSGTSSTARVSLSISWAKSGDKVTVYVSGFPANALIDFRLGQEGKAYSVVYDGVVGVDGSTNQVIVIPEDADDNEYWVVTVQTTSQKDGVTVISPRILINE